MSIALKHAAAVFLTTACWLLCAVHAPAAQRMNVIFILADDLGWNDSTLYGGTKFYKTPNLERLAKRGMTFSRAYSASPLCSPTRASILTGMSPARIGITAPDCHLPEERMHATVADKAPPHQKVLPCQSATRLDTSYVTLAEDLNEAGYATAHFGKWHLGPEPFSPLQQGFDVDLPHTSGPGPAGSFVAPWKFKDFKERAPGEHIEDRMADEAVAWMEKNKDRPFFLNYWQFSVHAPFNAKKGLVEKYRASANAADPQHSPTYAAMVESMDDAVGKLLDAVDRLGIADRTAIVFLSDNGGNMYDKVDGTSPTSNAPLRGGKATVYEGGTRVPCVVSWPDVTSPGSRSEVLIQSTDFHPTILDLLGLKPRDGRVFDGISIAGALEGKPLQRAPLFCYFPHSPVVPDTLPPAASVTGEEWKLIRLFHQGENGAHAWRLYNLRDDIGETRDRSAERPDKVRELDALIEKFLADTKAVVPKPNPRFDPKAPVPAKAAARRGVAKSGKPNIVVLLADDWRYDTLGCAGSPVVQTPHIDRLADEGLRFTHACVTTAICGVSRASLFTGQWMSRHGNPAFKMFDTPWSRTYPGLLRENGYHVGHVGKWHNGKFPAAEFDFGRAYSGTHWIKQPDGTKIHVTDKNKSDALEFLRTRPKDKPFCLTLAFFAPHAEDENPLQYLPQPEFMKLYQDVAIPVPPNATDESFRRLPPFIANEKNEGRNRWRWRFDTPEKYQTMMKNYYRLATGVDATCGSVLAELEKQGMMDNTLVIFTGDNGYFHGEHQLADKWYPHQESIRVPLIIRDPRMAKPLKGKTNDDFALNVDLAPTILAAAGIEMPATMQGRNLAPLYQPGEKPEWRAEFFYEHATIRNTDFIPSSEALVTKDWKYVLWPDFKTEQLFDLKADPMEEKDLAADPSCKERIAEMRKRFLVLKQQAR